MYLAGGRYLAGDGGWSDSRRVIGRVNCATRYHGITCRASPKRMPLTSQDKDGRRPWTWSRAHRAQGAVTRAPVKVNGGGGADSAGRDVEA